jgi:cytochrome c oxidase subunit 2
MSGIQSALEPAGMQAEKIDQLWQIFLGVSVVVYVLVLVFLLVALLRKRPAVLGDTPSPGVQRAVQVATGVTVVTLFGLLTASILTGRALSDVPDRAIQIGVIGRQWWWQIEYDHRDRSKRVTTANEIVIPVGEPVTLHLQSPDVIHSFWVPNLHGKRDLIPGKPAATLTLRADRPGVYRGQCAEFCGYQHANMALWVTALPRADYETWLEASRQPSRAPSTAKQREGQEVFMRSPCPLCHTIQGTPASGKTGPDLTHFASRRSIGAGVVPNRRGFLGGWILDAQHIKPGSQMPSIALGQGELDPLIDYLESLK